VTREIYTHAAALLAILVLGGVVLEALMIAHRSRADDFIFLTRAESAEWLRADRPMKMGLMEDPAQQSERTQYRKAFSVDRPLSTLTLRFRAMTQATVTLNGAPIFEGPSPASWKTWRTVKIAPLPQGDYTLVFDVTNPSGPALVQAVLPELDIATDTTWHTRSNDKTWTPARSAHTIGPAPASRAFSRSDAALFRALPYLLPAVVLVLAWRIAREGSRRIPAWLRREPSAAHFRWGLLAAFVALAINNFFRVPVWFGFDIVGHMEYIHYVAELRTLPLAPEGWKMNEAPLFYLVSALPYSLFYRGLSPDQNILVMRVIPMLCGVAQIEIAYRTAQYAFPKRDDAQIVATAVSALIPMHLYLTQFPRTGPTRLCWASCSGSPCFQR